VAREVQRISVSEETIKEIVQRILRVCSPDRVILFGSAAMGTMNPDSDIDLLVIEPQVQDVREEATLLRAALDEVPYPIDVIVMSRERFDETRAVIGGIAFPAAHYGRVIYEAP
jgi:predicted nucleotidyltransferase